MMMKIIILMSVIIFMGVFIKRGCVYIVCYKFIINGCLLEVGYLGLEYCNGEVIC